MSRIRSVGTVPNERGAEGHVSISLDQNKIRDFGNTIYRLKRDDVDADGHETIEHETLFDHLHRTTMHDLLSCRNCVHNCSQTSNVGRGVGIACSTTR